MNKCLNSAVCYIHNKLTWQLFSSTFIGKKTYKLSFVQMKALTTKVDTKNQSMSKVQFQEMFDPKSNYYTQRIFFKFRKSVKKYKKSPDACDLQTSGCFTPVCPAAEGSCPQLHVGSGCSRTRRLQSSCELGRAELGPRTPARLPSVDGRT